MTIKDMKVYKKNNKLLGFLYEAEVVETCDSGLMECPTELIFSPCKDCTAEDINEVREYLSLSNAVNASGKKVFISNEQIENELKD